MVRDELKALSIQALKAHDKETRAQLSGVLGRFIEEEKSRGFDGWTEQAQRDLVARYVKSLKSSLPDLREGPIKDGYVAEIALLDPFLPQLLDEQATRAIVEPIAAGARSLGQCMGMVMKDHKGKVDAALVRRIAQEAGLK